MRELRRRLREDGRPNRECDGRAVGLAERKVVVEEGEPEMRTIEVDAIATVVLFYVGNSTGGRAKSARYRVCAEGPYGMGRSINGSTAD